MTHPIRRPVLMAAALAVLGAAWLSSAQAPRDGGPSGRSDSYGYLVLDQTSPLCGYQFVDLQGGGSPLTLEAPHAAPGDPPAADDGGAVWVLGGPFEIYGWAEGALVVSSNGFLGFAASLDREDGRDYSNDTVLPAVPGYTAPGGSPTFSIPARVMAYHSDLVAGAGGALHAQHFAVCPRPSGAFPGEGCTVVQWSDWSVTDRPGETATFQALVYHYSFAIALQYQQVDGTGGEGVTVAIQDHRARRALAYATGAAGALNAGGAVCFFEPRFPPGGPLADLEADLDAGADQGDGAFELELAVTNDGPSPATGVTAVLSLPAGFEVISSTCPGGLAGGTWGIGDLPPGGWETCLAQVQWDAGPGGLAEFTVSGLETDPDPLNNTATVLLAPPLYIVAPSAGPNGSIAPDTPQNVDHGQTAVFTVTPDEGYTALVGGTCGGELVGDLYTTEPITADCTVHAEFELLRWPLTVTLSGPGGGAVISDPPGIDCPGDCTAEFDHGTLVTLSAEPNSVSTFTGWSGEGCSGTGPCVVTMEGARSVTAAFAVIPGIIVPVCLDVDTLDGGGAAGNLNSILEPGETVAVAPTWRNTGSSGVAATGLASELTGPGTGYFLADGTADYGAIPADGDANCGDATGNCYLVSLEVPAERPKLHWDLTFTETLSTGEETTWTIHVGDSFADVGVDHWAYRFIETLLHAGVTAGCGGLDYCPAATLTRWQMAVFLAKAMIGDEALLPDSGTVPGLGDYTCGAGGVSVFGDVPPADPACRHIHSIAAQGVTVGCGGGLYCPSDTVTRWQMAVFLAKAMVGDEALLPDLGVVPGMGGYICGAGGISVFGDLLPTDPACRHIHYIAAQGVTAGCGGGDYCPASDLSRAEMAVFLVKAFGLDLCGFAQQPQEIAVMLPGDVPLVMVRIPGGVFMMGAPDDERGSEWWEKPQHQVTLTQDFYLGKYPVTQGQWVAVMGENPSYFQDCGHDCPVERISWDDVCGGNTGSACLPGSFVGKLNAHLVATGQPGAGNFRMPTEAEWERGARGGTTGPFSFDTSGNPEWHTGCGTFPEADAHMWWCANVGPGGTKPVGQKMPNPYGLQDVHGHVWEWVGDRYGDYDSDAKVDPTGSSTGWPRVFRGGSIFDFARDCRSAIRQQGSPSLRFAGLGFRLARSR